MCAFCDGVTILYRGVQFSLAAKYDAEFVRDIMGDVEGDWLCI